MVEINTEKQKNFDAKRIIGGSKGILKRDDQIYQIEVTEDANCTETCPAGINVKAYINLIKNKKTTKLWSLNV